MATVHTFGESTEANPLLDAALAYAGRGWRVFPLHGMRNGLCTCGTPDCENPGKHPRTGHGLHDATVNEAALRRWWAQWPDANIGLRAEDIGVVVDIDPRNGGDDSYDRLCGKYGHLPDTVEVLTGGGGGHLYFLTTAPIRSGKLPSFPGIDIKSANSYVVAPPSLHASGRRYEFEASSDLWAGQSIAPAPEWIYQLRGESTAHAKPQATDIPALTPAPPSVLADVIDALSALDPDMHHDDWVRVGQAIHSQLWCEGFDTWHDWSAKGRKYSRTSARGMARKWASFNALGDVGIASLFYMAKEAGWTRATGTENVYRANSAESVIILACDLPSALKPPQWLVRHYLEAQALSVLFGEPGAGKSFIGLDLGLSIATGKAWHTHRVQQTPVIYLCGEGWSGLQRRMHAWRDWHEVDWRSAPFALTKRAIALGNKQAVEALKRDIDAAIERLGDAPGLFIVDTLARNFGAGDENSTKDMSLFIDHVGAYLMDAYKAAVMLVHHTGHGDKQRARGSSSLKGAVDAEYFVTRSEAGIVELSGLKMKDAQIPESLYFSMRVVDLGIRDEDGEPVTSVVPVMVSAPSAPPMGEPRRGAPRGSGDVQRACLELLVRMLAEARANLAQGGFDPLRARVSVKAWQSQAIEQRIVSDRKRFFDRRQSLESAGLVRVENGFAYPVSEDISDAETS